MALMERPTTNPRPVWHVITNNGELHLHAPDRREAILCSPLAQWA
jgi:hypothetical protein